MSGLINLQRKAIENLIGNSEAVPHPPLDDTEALFDQDGMRLHVAGVSKGIGSAATVPNVDVLVLTKSPTNRTIDTTDLACDYAVLMRGLNEFEAGGDELKSQGIARRCVELVSPVAMQGGGVVFVQTGKVNIYSAIT